MTGPDHWFSENPENLRKWIHSIRIVYEMLGNPLLVPTQGELKNKKEFQRVIVASRDLEKGVVLDDGCFAMRRVSSGVGLSPKYVELLRGYRLDRFFKKGEPISL